MDIKIRRVDGMVLIELPGGRIYLSPEEARRFAQDIIVKVGGLPSGDVRIDFDDDGGSIRWKLSIPE
jgi:hypothetical protein